MAICKIMKKANFTIRLTVRPSQLDPSRAKIRATLRLSDGRRIYFTSKGSVDTYTAQNLFDTTGRPYDCENYDKSVYRIMRGLYQSICESMMDLLHIVAGINIEDISTEEIRKNVSENMEIWNRNHEIESGYKWNPSELFLKRQEGKV